jgi:RNA-directed DNA polymerase
MFERNLPGNLYKLWNRMSSGSYFPPPVKQVEIPKAKGGTRKPGIPTVSDRIAQTVVKQIIEPKLEPVFHADSYGYRPGRSAKQAVAVPESGAGNTTGWSSSTSRRRSIGSIMRC